MTNINASVLDKLNVSFLAAFGSSVSGKTHKESDLDLAVFLNKNPTSDEFFSLFSLLQDAFKGQNVHLNILNNSDLLFRHKVLTEGKFIAGSEIEFNKYKLLTHKIYIDDMPRLNKYFDKVIKKNQENLKAKIYD